jgi:FAD:protein FMN transferase
LASARFGLALREAAVYPCAPRPGSGEVAEWSKALDWNSSYIFTGVRGFESHPLRQFEQFERNAPFVGRFRSCRSSRAAVTRLAAVLPIAALALLACAPAPSPERIAGATMGTTYEVVVTDRPAHVARDDLQSAVDAALDEINSHLSGWDPHSELARFNAATATDWIPVSLLLARAVSEAQSVTQASGGAFDVTVSPLVRAWGFGAGAVEDGAAPTPAEIEWLRESVGYRKLQSRLRPPALRKSVPTLHVDLDGIAPGIAVDRIADRLETHGIRDYLVELGGEVRARGRSPAGRPWRVAVEAPLTGQRQPYAIVELDRMGVSTSGDYRDYRELDGRRLSHTIDPRTAAPVVHGLASVTVLHPSTAAADAWATALMVLGPEEGMALARRLDLAVLFIARAPDGSLVESATPGFERFRRAAP